MKITNQDTKSPTISIEIPKGHEPQYTQVGDYIKITFEPKEEPKLPETWEDLVTVTGYRYDINGKKYYTCSAIANTETRGMYPTSEESEASIALAQLLQLRNAWSGKHCDDFKHGADIYWSVNFSNVFCFHEKELCGRFQTQFADLIKIASPLL